MSQEQQTIPTNNKKKQNKKEESPQTGDIVIDYVVLIVIAVTLIFDIIYFAIIKKDNKKFNKIILIGSFVILLSSIIIKETFAFTYAEMNIKSNIKIKKLPRMKQTCYAYYYTDEVIEAYLSGEEVERSEPEIPEDCLDWFNIMMNELEGYNEVIYEKTGGLYTYDDLWGMTEDVLIKLIFTTTKEMPETYDFNNYRYNKIETKDISEKQNGSVIVGIYKNEPGGLLLLIGGEGGVEAPKNSTALLSGIDNYFQYLDYMDLNNLDVSNVTNMSLIFAYNMFLSSSDNLKIDTWDTSKNKHLYGAFMHVGGAISPYQEVKLDLSSFDTSNVIEMAETFGDELGFYSKKVDIDISKWDVSKVENLDAMFGGLGKYSQEINVKLFESSNNKIKSMAGMFSEIGVESENITIDFNKLDTSNVTNISGIFAEYGGKSIDLSTFNTSNVTDMSDMFSGYEGEILNLSKLDTSNVTDMSGMFSHFEGETLDLSSFDTSNVTNMSTMFSSYKGPTLDFSHFNTSNVTDMSGMFSSYEGETLDLSVFDTSNVTNMQRMFNYSQNLKTIYVSDKWDVSNVNNSSYMFSGCSNLVGGAGTTYNYSKTDISYAHVDGGEINPGYFTYKSKE